MPCSGEAAFSLTTTPAPPQSLCPSHWAGDSLRIRRQRAFLGLRWGRGLAFRPSRWRSSWAPVPFVLHLVFLCKAGPGPRPSSPDKLFLGWGAAHPAGTLRPNPVGAGGQTRKLSDHSGGPQFHTRGSWCSPHWCQAWQDALCCCVHPETQLHRGESGTFLTGGVCLPSLGARALPIPAVATGGVRSLQPAVCVGPHRLGRASCRPSLPSAMWAAPDARLSGWASCLQGGTFWEPPPGEFQQWAVP